ncbi:MAG: hypothetical protein AB7P04_05635 [Bacteriovoracia bacterium]
MKNIYQISVSAMALLAFAACNKSDFDDLKQFEVKQPMTLAVSKKKSITVPVGPASVEAQFASKRKDKEVQSAMVLKLQGKKVPFDLKQQSILVVKNRMGRDVPHDLGGLQVSAAESGQNLGVAISVLARENVDYRSQATESCTYTTSHTICRGHGRERVCRTETVTHRGYQEVEHHYFGNESDYRIELTAADGSLAASGSLYVNAVQHSYHELTACR